MIGPVKSSGSICSHGLCSGKGWWIAWAADDYIVMPAGHQRRNRKGIWELASRDGPRRLQFLPRDPIGPAFWQEYLIATTGRSYR